VAASVELDGLLDRDQARVVSLVLHVGLLLQEPVEVLFFGQDEEESENTISAGRGRSCALTFT